MPLAAPSSGQEIFSATLTPHRSLGRRGYRILMAGLASLSLAGGAYFWSLGGWPVTPFIGADFLAVWLAFRTSYRAGGLREEVSVRRDAVIVRKVAPNGRAREFRFNPAWTRIVANHDDERAVTRILLTNRGLSLPVGGFLNPDDRTSFAAAFAAALAEARR